MSWIDTDSTFADWCREAQLHPAIAIDTEFVWTKTYYPALGLLQMAYDENHAALIDVLAITDTAPLRGLLENPAVIKIFHEAASDLPILRRWCGALPQNVVDTRIAAGFAGLTASLSLSKLVASETGITLAKTETRTDWLQRPLTAEQLEYAAGDVNYMPRVYESLHAKLLEYNNLAWYQEDMSELSARDYYEEIKPEDCWKHVSGMGRFRDQALAIIRELAAWRENFCQSHNIARPRVISDEQIIAAVETRPRQLTDIIAKMKLWPDRASKYGDAIIDCIRRGEQTALADCPQQKLITMDVKKLKADSQRVLGLARKRAGARHIDPVLVCTRRDADSFVIAANERPWPFEHRLLHGWRHELLGEAIDALAISKFA